MVRCVEYFAELISEVGEMLKRRRKEAIEDFGSSKAIRLNSIEILKNASLERASLRGPEWASQRKRAGRLCKELRRRPNANAMRSA